MLKSDGQLEQSFVDLRRDAHMMVSEHEIDQIEIGLDTVQE